MTRFQYRTMRELLKKDLSIDDIRAYNLTTLGSMIHNGWVERRGTRIVVTNAGSDA